jgi:hypothetical protein
VSRAKNWPPRETAASREGTPERQKGRLPALFSRSDSWSTVSSSLIATSSCFLVRPIHRPGAKRIRQASFNAGQVRRTEFLGPTRRADPLPARPRPGAVRPRAVFTARDAGADRARVTGRARDRALGGPRCGAVLVRGAGTPQSAIPSRPSRLRASDQPHAGSRLG